MLGNRCLKADASSSGEAFIVGDQVLPIDVQDGSQFGLVETLDLLDISTVGRPGFRAV